MKGFELYEPTTVKQAVDTLTKLGPKAKVLAGGSDLVAGVMKDWVEGAGMPLPSALVDITTIPQLRGIKVDKTGATIGANATIVCGHTLGRYCFISAGAVVTKSVPPNCVVAGNPAILARELPAK